MFRKGRDLELLIARLEKVLAPEDAIITSPDYLPDKITGGRREIDVSIKSRIGSSPILVILECRDRSSAEDVTWIEQLASKRNSVGADKVIAVSSSKFSEPAIKQALFYGIEICRIEDITRADFTDWVPASFSEHKDQNALILGFSVGVHPNQIKNISKKFLAKIASIENGLDVKVFTYKPTGQKFSAIDIFKLQMQSSADSIFQNVPLDGTPVQRPFQFYFSDPEDRFCIPGSSGPIDVLDLMYSAELSIKVTAIPLTKISYSNTNDPLIRTIEYKSDDVIMSLNKDIESGQLSVYSK